ncbi:hypothetical protein Tco_0471229 [Tanacetum coccineum]
MFTDNTTKVDSEPPNGSNDDITNPYECDQTLNVSAGTTNLSAGLALQRQMTSVLSSSGLALHRQMASADNTSSPVPLNCCSRTCYFNRYTFSTRIDQDTPSTSTSQTTQEAQSHVILTSVEEDDHGIKVTHMDNDR